MPIDRAATLRNAETLVRQGKLEPAIAEYLRVIEDQPQDWASANTVGDLYVRVGQIDNGVAQFLRIADTLFEQGFLPKAGALYKKVLKLKPDDERALMQAAEIAASQGLYADARGHLNAVIEKRKLTGDAFGAAQARIRLGALDPSDHQSRIAAAAARVEIGDVHGAVRDLTELAAELTEKGRAADAIQAMSQAAKFAPEDDSIRAQLLDMYVAAGDFTHAREHAVTVAELKTLADALDLHGRHDEALEILRDAAWLDPNEPEAKADLARAFVSRGDTTTAAEFLNLDVAGENPQLRLGVAEIHLRSGELQEGIAIAREVLDSHPGERDRVAAVGWSVSEQSPEAGFPLVELAADSAVAQHDWLGAATALQEFVTRVPNHIPGLMRLVEVSVDGGLESTMYSAQGQLADAYLEAGRAPEARQIAEDLVARGPWDRANLERFRKALVLLNDPDPDGVIAERLGGEKPFTSTDRAPKEFYPPVEAAAPPPEPPLAARVPTGNVAPEAIPRAAVSETKLAQPAGGHSVDVDLDDIEVDLSVILDDLDKEGDGVDAVGAPSTTAATTTPNSATAETAPAAEAARDEPPAGPPPDLDDVFAKLRDEVSRTPETDNAEQEFNRALSLRDAGDVDGCIAALRSAARAPKLRFATASLLGRLYKERGALPQALEWFERAAQAPAPTSDEYYGLLFELADGLEATGETARALAVCLEIQAGAGSYKDVDQRVDRLNRAQG